MNLSLEWKLYCKVKSLDDKANTFDGLTTTEERKENLKHTIQNIGPEVVFSVENGKYVTLKQMWMRTYGVDWE